MFSSMFKGFIEGVVYATMIIVVMSAFFTFAPDMESKYMPVIKDFKATIITQYEEYRTYNITFNKVRSCELDLPSVSWYYTNDGYHMDRVQVIMPTRQGDPTRPIGENSSKEWKVYIPRGEIVKNQKFVVYHYCHPGWRTRTEVNITEK